LIHKTCCGQPAFNSGYQDEAKEIAIKFLEDFDDDRYIVCPSGSCVSMVSVFYKQLFENDEKYLKLSEKIIKMLLKQTIKVYNYKEISLIS